MNVLTRMATMVLETAYHKRFSFSFLGKNSLPVVSLGVALHPQYEILVIGCQPSGSPLPTCTHWK
jgi:hypothetical protein